MGIRQPHILGASRPLFNKLESFFRVFSVKLGAFSQMLLLSQAVNIGGRKKLMVSIQAVTLAAIY